MPKSAILACPSLSHQNVGRLNVAMYNTLCVGVFQRVRKFLC